MGTPAASHASLAVAFLHGRNDKLVTAGQVSVKVALALAQVELYYLH